MCFRLLIIPFFGFGTMKNIEKKRIRSHSLHYPYDTYITIRKMKTNSSISSLFLYIHICAHQCLVSTVIVKGKNKRVDECIMSPIVKLSLFVLVELNVYICVCRKKVILF